MLTFVFPSDDVVAVVPEPQAARDITQTSAIRPVSTCLDLVGADLNMRIVILRGTLRWGHRVGVTGEWAADSRPFSGGIAQASFWYPKTFVPSTLVPSNGRVKGVGR